MSDTGAPVDPRDRRPTWVMPTIVAFWGVFVGTLVFRWAFSRLSGLFLLLLVSLFLSLAIEPGADRLVARGWRRGRATALVLFLVLVLFAAFVAAISTFIGQQVADLLGNTDRYVDRIVTFINDAFNTKIDSGDVKDQLADPNGGFQKFIRSQSDDALRLSLSALGGLLQLFSCLLFTFYLVADGPRLRRAICSRLRPARQAQVLQVWELAITKTGGYLYSRALLAGLSALFHWVAFTLIGVPAPVALALWVGIISQFIPVVGTYIAGVLPVLVTLLDPGSSPLRALLVFGFIMVYQQVENYVFAPKITARTLELHPAIAFGAALAGAALLGPVGALLALPAAEMAQAIGSEWGRRHDVIDSRLTSVDKPPRPRPMPRRRKAASRQEGGT